MDNKLSKLSKPVAWMHSQLDISKSNSDKADLSVDVQARYSDALYSQEYVSALLADNEAKDKRIAELEAKTAMTMGVGNGGGSLFVHGDYDSIKAAHSIVFENESLRAKLATPVRLPDLCGDGENDTEYTEGLNDGINQSAKAIRAAGFTVEGDEQ